MGDEQQNPDLDELLEPMELLDSTDRLFTINPDGWSNASIHRGLHPWGLYAAGYKEAGDLLVHQLEMRKGGQDTLVYPIVFLYRQYLELTIKDLIRDARELQKVYGDYPKTHELAALWDICQALLLQIFPREPNNVMKDVARLIGEFSAVDPQSMSFRYPEDREGNPSLDGIAQIDLFNLRDVIAKIATFLSGSGSLVYEYLQEDRAQQRSFDSYF
jgi:HEPN domain-containing protein